jgi:hypothetical protein
MTYFRKNCGFCPEAGGIEGNKMRRGKQRLSQIKHPNKISMYRYRYIQEKWSWEKDKPAEGGNYHEI